jgi:hypothetical protein
MRRVIRFSAMALLLLAACTEAPTGPERPKPSATPPDPSLLTPFLLPPGADWGQYFVSFNRDRSLSADVIHYSSGTVSGRGAFAIPGVGVGQLRVTSATPYGGYLPNGTGTSGVPESSIATGTATFLTGQRVPFTLDLHSNYWPNATNTYDTATLYFCPVATYTSCTPYPFFGELHHEPQ